MRVYLLFIYSISAIAVCAQHFTRIQDGSQLVTESVASVGASWNDINKDGWIDLFISGFSSSTGNNNRLYINNGDGTYSLDTLSPYMLTGGLGTAITLLSDFNTDGNTDVFMGNYEDINMQEIPHSWFINQGSPNFSLLEQNPTENPASSVPSASWVDFDKDADLDLYLTSAGGTKDLYYENDGLGNFSIVDTLAFLQSRDALLTYDSWIDYDNDGDLDLYIATFDLFGSPENLLYQNRYSETGIIGYFKKVEIEGLTDWESPNIGVNWVDIDNDLDLDLYANVYYR